MSISLDFSLDERVALVIGAGGTLGRAIALGLARNGARVVLGGRTRGKLAETAKALAALDEMSQVVALDAMDRESLEEARDAILASWGNVDILINAAGGNTPGATLPKDGSLLNLDAKAFQGVVEVNLLSVLLPLQVFVPGMVDGGHGSIIHISSMSAARPLTRVAGYGASKAALENFTKFVAVNLAQNYGEAIRVNAIAPGFIAAEQNRGLLVDADGELTERGRAVVGHTPMGRLGRPGDVAGAACWLASDASSFVTGAVIPIDGGFSAYPGV